MSKPSHCLIFIAAAPRKLRKIKKEEAAGTANLKPTAGRRRPLPLLQRQQNRDRREAGQSPVSGRHLTIKEYEALL